jgi:hypothetical protein
MNTTTHWRKIGSAHMLADAYSTIYIKRIGRAFHLIARNPNPIQGGWLTLGIYPTLRDAKTNGSALMDVTP